MRTRTRIDLLLLLLLLGVAAWMWMGRLRDTGEDTVEVGSSPVPTPRVQELIRRTSVAENGEPGAIRPYPSPSDTAEDSEAPDEAAAFVPAIGLIRVTTPGGEVPAGRVEVFSTDGRFRTVVHNGRFGLQSVTGSMELQARVEDEHGARMSNPATLALWNGETSVVDLVVPEPVFTTPGFELRAADGYAEVTGMRPGGPAAQAGMMTGDAVIAIDGYSVEGLDDIALNTLLLGPPGEDVVLRMVIRNDAGELEEVEARLPRETLPE